MSAHDEQLESMLTDLDAALRVAPSPALVERVRTEIRREPRAVVGAWSRWALAAAAVLILGVGSTWFATRRSQVLPSVATPVQQQASAASAPPAAEVPALAGVASLATAASRSTARTTGRRGAASSATPVRPSSMEVLIAKDELDALQRLMEGLKQGRNTVPGETGPEVDADGRLVKVDAIEIPKISVNRLEPLLPPGGGGQRR